MKQREWRYLLVACLSVGVYLLAACLQGGIGFPLDDAWIHQVYARNLGLHGEFAFFPGQPSAGSTAPLWTILLAAGYLLRVEFHVWTFLLGVLFLGLGAIVLARLAESLCSTRITHSTPRLVFLVPLFFLFEWHLAWSAASSMEITLFILLSVLLFERFFAGGHPGILGVIGGLLTLTRPEGIVLAGLVGVGRMIQPREGSGRRFDQLRSLGAFAAKYALGLGLIVAPYLLFNLATSGTLLPNTFYAKNAEYASLFADVPFVVRWVQLLVVPFVGAQILLIPGLVYIAIVLASKRQWLALIPLTWVLILPGLYALRLPVAYQYGRYEMPVIPFIILYGIWGTGALLSRLKSWVVRTTGVLSIGAALLVFWLIGAARYAEDVALIDCEMMGTARWVAANAPAGAVIAAHDIGALGYFTERPFIDLAGLVTPDVIPFIRDQGRLREYLLSRRTAMVIVFPDWYSAFAADPRFVPVYQTNCEVTRRAGGTNMTVYELR